MHSKLDDVYIPASEWVAIMLPLLEEGHELRISPLGTSMLPFILGGRDEVVLSSCFGVRLKRGDVVLYSRDDGTHVLHRIHHIKDDKFYMLGDYQTWIEGAINNQHVVAVARAFIRKGKHISCDNPFYKTVTGLWLFLRPIRPLLLRIYRFLF